MATETAEIATAKDRAYANRAAAAERARQGIQFGKARRRIEDVLACDPPLTAAQLTVLIRALDSARKRAS